MSHQSHRDVFVSNNPALLQSGTTDALAVGQIGIFLYDVTKNQTALAEPNFRNNRAIQIFQGTPELPGNLLAAVANASDRTKPIKGKLIKDWRGFPAARGQNQKVTIGFDGVDTTKNISALCEQTKTVFLKLSGGAIDQMFHTEGKGFVRQYNIFSGCCDDCGDDCAQVNRENMADDLVRQITTDPILGFGTRTGNKLITARKITNSAPVESDSTCTEYLLSICDNGDSNALGLVQSQYPGSIVTQKSRSGSNTVYQLIQDSELDAPADFSNEGMVLINDCGVCPSGAGYVSVDAGNAYKVLRNDAGNDAALATLRADYGLTGDEAATRPVYQFGESTYVIVSDTEITALEGDTVEFLGETRNSCVLATPTEIAWTEGDEYERFNKTFSITLHDNVCGVSRLAELQNAYPDLVIVEAAVGANGCVRRFTTEVASNCVLPGCAPETPVWVTPDAYQGIEWTSTPADGEATNVGVVIESAFVDRVTNECSFDFWNYNSEPIFIEVSQHSQDYNDKPTICSEEWPITEIQAAKIPTGVGAKVREDEKFFKGYDRKYRDVNPIVNGLNDAILQADPNVFYDQYTLLFEFEFNQGWFSEKLTDQYRVEFYFPEGQGKEFEAAINAYVASVGIDLPPVYL